MIKVGLTGGIGTGKSTVARMFATMGVAVFEADAESRKVLMSAGNYDVLLKLFGPQAFDGLGHPDRKYIASIVFNQPDKLAALNEWIHPLVVKAFGQFCVQHGSEGYVLHEAAILFESGLGHLVDKSILVTAPMETCLARLSQRDGMTRADALARMEKQWPEERKLLLADYRIINDGQVPVLPQVLDVHHKLLEVA